MLDPDAAVSLQRLAQIAVPLLPEPLRIAGGEPRENVSEDEPSGHPSFEVLVVEDGARGHVHMMTVLVDQRRERQGRHLPEDVGKLASAASARRCGLTRAPAGAVAALDSARPRPSSWLPPSGRASACLWRHHAHAMLFNHSSPRTLGLSRRHLVVCFDPQRASAVPDDAGDHRMSEKFDAVVIGSGFGGSITACRLAEQG